MPLETASVYDLPTSIPVPWVRRSLRQLMQQQRNVPKRSLGAGVGVAVSIALHACLVGYVVWGGGTSTPIKRPERTAAAANVTSRDEGPVMTVIFVEDARRLRDPEDEDVASHALTTPTLGVEVATLDALRELKFPSLQSEENDRSDETSDDPARHAMLFGRYTGQIKAR